MKRIGRFLKRHDRQLVLVGIAGVVFVLWAALFGRLFKPQSRAIERPGHGYLHALSADGTQLAIRVAETPSRFRLWDARTGKRHALHGNDEAPFDDVRFSPNGNYTIAMDESGGLRLWSQAERRVLELSDPYRADPDRTKLRWGFSSNGELLWYHTFPEFVEEFGKEMARIRIVETRTRRVRGTVHRVSGPAALSPSGAMFATTTVENKRPLVRVQDTDSWNVLHLIDCPAPISHLVFSPDERLLVGLTSDHNGAPPVPSKDGQVSLAAPSEQAFVWELQTAKLKAVCFFPSNPMDTEEAVFAGGNRYLIVPMRDGYLAGERILDLEGNPPSDLCGESLYAFVSTDARYWVDFDYSSGQLRVSEVGGPAIVREIQATTPESGFQRAWPDPHYGRHTYGPREFIPRSRYIPVIGLARGAGNFEPTLAEYFDGWLNPGLRAWATASPPDGGPEVTWRSSSELRIYDALNGRLEFVLPGAEDLLCSANGKVMAVKRLDGSIHLWDFPLRKPVGLIHLLAFLHTALILAPCWWFARRRSAEAEAAI